MGLGRAREGRSTKRGNTQRFIPVSVCECATLVDLMQSHTPRIHVCMHHAWQRPEASSRRRPWYCGQLSSSTRPPGTRSSSCAVAATTVAIVVMLHGLRMHGTALHYSQLSSAHSKNRLLLRHAHLCVRWQSLWWKQELDELVVVSSMQRLEQRTCVHSRCTQRGEQLG